MRQLLGKKWIIGILLLVIAILYTSFFWFKTPSNTREWEFGQDRLPYAEIFGETIVVHNIRDNAPNSSALYIEKKYHLSDIQGVDFVVSGFSKFKGIAHTFLSFRFKNEEPLSMSVEARREKGEKYSPFWGSLHEYEILYVVGTERDIIGSRLKEYNEQLSLYKTSLSPIEAQALFLDMMKRINHLRETPEFYNTFSNNCTSNIMNHLSSAKAIPIPYSYHFFLPGYSDALLYALNFIETNMSLDDIRKKARMDEKAKNISREDPQFSERIRNL